MTYTWLPLRGPNERGMSPKACPVSGWNDPAYRGLSTLPGIDGWYGLRLEHLIVVDCDTADAAATWLEHVGLTQPHTWVRKTPHGYHFIYRRTPAASMVAAQKLIGMGIQGEIKTGYGHQIVFRAPGYFDVTTEDSIVDFDPSWEPQTAGTNDVPVNEWSELPDGYGDSFMISAAGKFREWGMSYDAILACLRDMNTTLMPTKPMPPSSLKRIAASAVRYRPGDPEVFECPKCGTGWET